MGSKGIRSVRTHEYKEMFEKLPERVRKSAERRYREYFLRDCFHPLLNRHDLHDVDDAHRDSFSVEMHYGYRSVAFYDEKESCYVWYWCGTHAEYDQRFRGGR